MKMPFTTLMVSQSNLIVAQFQTLNVAFTLTITEMNGSYLMIQTFILTSLKMVDGMVERATP